MANHTITVSFVEDRVRAVPNPLPERGGTPPQVGPGDKVTWNIPENRTLEAVFSSILDLDSKGQPTGNRRDDPGPFKGDLSSSPGVIVGTVSSEVSQEINHATRYLYKLFENNEPLLWVDRVPGGDETDGGGIDTPRTPP